MIKVNASGNITIINTDAPNNRASKYIKKNSQMKVEIDNSTIVFEDFNILLPVMDRTTK